MIIDGIFASEAIDSSGEILDIDGCDISSLEAGDGTLNWEHKGTDDDKTRSPNDHVGHIVYAKRIFGEADCENDRQRKYWREVKLPFIYGVARLYDGSGEPGAVALAAQIRDHKVNGEPILVRFSIEGSTLEKKGNRLVRSVARRVAATIKPCNKSCSSDVLEDPNSPFETKEQEKDLLKDVVARKSEDPMYGTLGSYELECDPELGEDLNKTYTAGNASSTPGALTGGAALQREDLKKKVVQLVKDFHDGQKQYSRSAFRTFLKTQLPEASDEFLDHFADLIDDYHVKLSKKESVSTEPLPTKVKAKLASKKAQEIPSQIPRPESPRLAGGQFPVVEHKPSRSVKSGDLATFDPEKGILSFGEGKEQKHFQADVSKDGWSQVLSDPKFGEMFDSIANNVKLVSDLRKKGVEVPGEFEIAAAMGGYSANEPVPVMEAAVGHTIDEFGDRLPELSQRPPTVQEQQSLNRRFQSGKLPHFGSGEGSENPDMWSKLSHTLITKEGKAHKIGKPSSKIGTLTYFHRMAPLLKDLVQKHGTDGQSIANELIKKKEEYEKWKGVQRQAYDKGISAWKRKRTKELEGLGYRGKKLAAALTDEQGKVRESYGNWGSIDEKLAYAGPVIEYLSNKTLRYMVGMLGATNVTVPDTHFTRHFFNQKLGDKESAKNLDTLKSVLLNPLNAHVLNSIDEFHRKNHPAAKWVKDRYFGGKDDPEATFLGFWAHWMNIPKHEEMTGRAAVTKEGEARDSSSNEGSTHASYFLHVARQMKKYGIPGWDKFVYKSEEDVDPELAQMSMPDRVQLALSDVADSYGPEAAALAYFAMVPALIAPVQHQQKQDQASKLMQLQGLSVDLKSALAQFGQKQDQGFKPDVRSLIVNIGGKPRSAGRFLVHNGQLKHLEDYHGLLGKLLPEGNVTDEVIKRMHAMSAHPDIEIGKDRSAEPENRVKEPIQDPVPVNQVPEAPLITLRPASVFEYTRVGHGEPHVLEVQNGAYLLDGNVLSYPEVALLIQNLKNGVATIRYKSSALEQKISKMESLIKAVAYAPDEDEENAYSPSPADPGSMDIEQALQHVRDAVSKGHLHPSVADALTSQLFHDPMLAGTNIGNKFAFDKFRAKQKPGVYLSMDGNDFKSVNDKFGHDVGDEAIKAMGSTLRGALQDSVGEETGKLFRNGGDEFTAYFPSHEHAVQFTRALRTKFDALPPVRENHKLSMSVGIAHNPQLADSALYEAKKQKFQPGTAQRLHEPGQVPTLAHSLMPGKEGMIPLGHPEHEAVKRALSPMPTPPSSSGPSVPTPSPLGKSDGVTDISTPDGWGYSYVHSPHEPVARAMVVGSGLAPHKNHQLLQDAGRVADDVHMDGRNILVPIQGTEFAISHNMLPSEIQPHAYLPNTDEEHIKRTDQNPKATDKDRWNYVLHWRGKPLLIGRVGDLARATTSNEQDLNMILKENQEHQGSKFVLAPPRKLNIGDAVTIIAQTRTEPHAVGVGTYPNELYGNYGTIVAHRPFNFSQNSHSYTMRDVGGLKHGVFEKELEKD